MFYNMKIHLFLVLCIVWFQSEGGQALQYDIKRGNYPYMALIYYPDESIVDSTGVRFQRGAVLINTQWLISAAIDHPVMDDMPLGFPVKTLIARCGAVTLDSNYTLNEDEDEQEREVILIIRPSKHNLETWWLTDITLLKTLMPFTETAAVAPTSVYMQRIDYNITDCKILIFGKKTAHSSDEKFLMNLTVDLLPSSVDNCGSQFNENNMLCAFDSEETKSAKHEAEFCLGNAGGPLICEGKVVGLQTYIENSCKPPHLYQLVAPWEKMISCGISGLCHTDPDCDICLASFKDLPNKNDTTMTLSSESPITIGDLSTAITEEESESVHASSPTMDTTISESDIPSRTEESSEETSDHETPSKTDESLEEKTEEKTEGKIEEKTEEKTEETTEVKTEEKTEETTEEKPEEKNEEKSEEKAEEKTEEKIEEKAEEKTEDKTYRETTSESQTTSETDIEVNTGAKDATSLESTMISTEYVETKPTTLSEPTSPIIDEAPVSIKVKPTMRKMFKTQGEGEETDEDNMRKMKADIEAQQKSSKEQPVIVQAHSAGGALCLTSTKCVVMYFSLLAYLVN